MEFIFSQLFPISSLMFTHAFLWRHHDYHDTDFQLCSLTHLTDAVAQDFLIDRQEKTTLRFLACYNCCCQLCWYFNDWWIIWNELLVHVRYFYDGLSCCEQVTVELRGGALLTSRWHNFYFILMVVLQLRSWCIATPIQRCLSDDMTL